MKFRDFVNKDFIGAGVVIITSEKKILLLKNEKNEWSFPGGMREGEEEPLETATRECYEETGYKLEQKPVGKLKFIKEKTGKAIYSFFVKAEEFTPKISWEHKDYKWVNYEKVDRKKLTDTFKPHWSAYTLLIKSL